MVLSQYLVNIIENPHFITVSGGGGKTTLLQTLGQGYKKQGKSVLLTTTTKFQSPKYYEWTCDEFSSNDSRAFSYKPSKPCVFLYANEYEMDDRKWKSPSLENIEKVKSHFDVCICEADGSRKLPIKIHTDRDPVIPNFTTYRIAVFGLSGIGKRINDVTFGYEQEGIVDKDFLNWYIENPQGLLKGNPNLVILNGRDYEIAKSLNWPVGVRVVASSILDDKLLEIIK